MVAILIPSLPPRRQALLAILLAGVTAQVPPYLELSLVPQVGHLDDVLAIDVSADGALTASAGADDVVLLWNADGAIVRRFQGHESKVTAVRFSPADGNLVTASEDGTLRLWDVRTGQTLRSAKAPTPVLARVLGDASDRKPKFFGLDVTQDGRVVAGYSSGARIWDPGTGSMSKRYGHLMYPVLDVAISRDGRVFATAQGNRSTYLWSADSGAQNADLSGHRSTVQVVAISADGGYVASGAKDGAILLWEPRKGPGSRTMCAHSAAVTALRFTQNGATLASGAEDGSLLLCDVSTGRSIRQLRTLAMPARAVAFHPDGSLSGAFGHTILTWDLTTARLPELAAPTRDPRGLELAEKWIRLPQVAKHASTGVLFGLAVSMDRRFACTNYGSMLTVWDTTSATVITQIPYEDKVLFTAAAFDRSAGRLAAGRDDGSLAVYEVPTGRRLASARFLKNKVEAVSWSLDGAAVVAGSADQYGTWVPGKTPPAPVPIPSKILSMVSSEDQKLFAIGQDKGVTFVDARTDKEKASGKPDHVEAVAFDREGRYAVTAGWELLLWTIPTFKTRSLKSPDSMYTAVDFSPVGKRLATGSVDGLVRLWNVETGTHEPMVEKHQKPVIAVFFTADGRWLWSASYDGTVRLWNVADRREAARVIRFADGTQAAYGASGRFDAPNPDGLTSLGWVVGDAPLRVLPVDVFVRDYLEPGLIERTMAGEALPPIRDLRELNRVRPSLQITNVIPEPGTDGVSVRVHVQSTKERQGARGELESLVQDVRLLRDGTLVAYRDGPIVLKPGGGNDLTFRGVRLPSGGADRSVTFTVYAFNADRVKSATTSYSYKPPAQTGAGARVYLLSIGVTTTTDPYWTLDFAGEDTRVVRERLSSALRGAGTIVPVTLAGSPQAQSSPFGADPASDGLVVPTKANIMATLDLLSGRAADPAVIGRFPPAFRQKLKRIGPDDLLVLWISAHGVVRNREFFVLPYDIGTGSSGRVTDALTRQAISSDELSRWLRDIDAGNSVTVIDACYGRAAVDRGEFKPAPLGNRGLGQLSYDKGMPILVAAQSDAQAVEANGLSLLARAFAIEGLSSIRPGQPKTLSDVLAYAASRVPQLAAARPAGAGTVQKPWLFDFRKEKREVRLTPLLVR